MSKTAKGGGDAKKFCRDNTILLTTARTGHRRRLTVNRKDRPELASLIHGTYIIYIGTLRRIQNVSAGREQIEARLYVCPMFALRTFGLVLLLASAALGQEVSSSPTEANITNNLMTVDYSVGLGTSSPNVFGVDDWFNVGGLGRAATVAAGIKVSRQFCALSAVMPVTTVAAYEAAMADGCKAGTVCDPDTWNWAYNREAAKYANAVADGLKMVLNVLAVPTWLSYDGTVNGVPTNYAVYDDAMTKVAQHFHPDFLEIENEPDLVLSITNSPYGDPRAAYFDMYGHAAQAIHAAQPSQSIGGPVVCCSPADWVPQFLASGSIRAGDINFVSYHNYANNNDEELMGVNVVTLVHRTTPAMPVYETEWNALSSCSDSTQNGGDTDPTTVPFVGMRLVNGITAGLQLMQYWEIANASNNDPSCSWLVNGVMESKTAVFELMSVTLGLGAGTFTVNKTEQRGMTTALGATNSAGAHVAVLVNLSDSQLVETVSLKNAGLVTDETWSAYTVSTAGGPTVSSPVNTRVTTAKGTATNTIAIPANSVVGIIVR